MKSKQYKNVNATSKIFLAPLCNCTKSAGYGCSKFDWKFRWLERKYECFFPNDLFDILIYFFHKFFLLNSCSSLGKMINGRTIKLVAKFGFIVSVKILVKITQVQWFFFQRFVLVHLLYIQTLCKCDTYAILLLKYFVHTSQIKACFLRI